MRRHSPFYRVDLASYFAVLLLGWVGLLSVSCPLFCCLFRRASIIPSMPFCSTVSFPGMLLSCFLSGLSVLCLLLTSFCLCCSARLLLFAGSLFVYGCPYVVFPLVSLLRFLLFSPVASVLFTWFLCSVFLVFPLPLLSLLPKEMEREGDPNFQIHSAFTLGALVPLSQLTLPLLVAYPRFKYVNTKGNNKDLNPMI